MPGKERGRDSNNDFKSTVQIQNFDLEHSKISVLIAHFHADAENYYTHRYSFVNIK